MKRKTRTQKGITLISLIITIVVLLILAAVAIASIKDGGILGYANSAGSQYNEARVNEQGTIVGYENYIKNYVGGEVEKDEVTMLSGDGQTYYTLAPTELSFRSSADINDFQEVQISGVTLDQSNYTMTEGSTIINLSIDYLKTLEEDDYSISIVSKTGSSSAGFSVVEPDVNSDGFYYNQVYTAYVDHFGANCGFIIHENGVLDTTVNAWSESCTYTVDGDNLTVSSASMGTFTLVVSPDGKTVYCNELDTNFVLGNESIVVDGDYIYTYNNDLGGYIVSVIDKTKDTYGAIKNGIYGYRTVKLADHMFENNDKLTKSPEIPQGSIIYVGENAFYGCSNITNVVLPDSVKSIGLNAFALCSKLSTFEIPPHVTEIGANAFKSCTSLTDIVIPDEVKIVGERAFEGCTSLESVTLLSNVKSIHTGAFADCTSLTSITYKGNMEDWNTIAFGDNWNANVPATKVVCYDGTVTL